MICEIQRVSCDFASISIIVFKMQPNPETVTDPAPMLNRFSSYSEPVDPFDVHINYRKKKLSLTVTLVAANQFHYFEGLFKEPDVQKSLIQSYGSFSNLCKKGLTKKQSLRFFNQGPNLRMEVPFLDSPVSRFGSLLLNPLAEGQELEKLRQLLDRQNSLKDILKAQLAKTVDSTAACQRQKQVMHQRIQKMEEMFTRASIPLFMKEGEKLVEFEEGNPNRVRLKPDNSAPVLLLLKNDLSCKLEFRVKLSFPPLQRLNDHWIGVLTQQAAQSIDGKDTRSLEDQNYKIMYRFSGQLHSNEKVQGCEDMRTGRNSYIQMTIDRREEVVRFERGQVTLATAQLKVLKNQQFRPFVMIAQANTTYEIQLL